MAEKMVGKVATGKGLEGDRGLGEGATLGLFWANSVDARDKSMGWPSALLGHFLLDVLNKHCIDIFLFIYFFLFLLPGA